MCFVHPDCLTHGSHFKHGLAKLNGPAMLEGQLELGLATPPAIGLRHDGSLDVVGTKHRLLQLNLQSQSTVIIAVCVIHHGWSTCLKH